MLMLLDCCHDAEYGHFRCRFAADAVAYHAVFHVYDFRHIFAIDALIFDAFAFLRLIRHYFRVYLLMLSAMRCRH